MAMALDDRLLTAEPVVLKVGDRFESEPCTRCSDRASGIVKAVLQFGGLNIAWDDAPDHCDCVCHDGWRIVNRRPAILSPDPEGD